MFKALVVVRNLQSSASALDFGTFTIRRAGARFGEYRESFAGAIVDREDWIFEKAYAEPPPGRPGSYGGIPSDIEEELLLLRLYKAGEIAFVKSVTVLPSGMRQVQPPSRAINDLNSAANPAWAFTIEPQECEPWKAFAADLKAARSWDSDWFSTARRYFLSGGAKPFDPELRDIDRIVDYATALEASLVPERDFNTRRVKHRARALVADDDPAQGKLVTDLVGKLYDFRSRLVHGGALTSEDHKWLVGNCPDIEFRVRSVLVAAVQRLPATEADRRVALAALFDVTDDDRGRSLVDKFNEIKTPSVRATVAAHIAKPVASS